MPTAPSCSTYRPPPGGPRIVSPVSHTAEFVSNTLRNMASKSSPDFAISARSIMIAVTRLNTAHVVVMPDDASLLLAALTFDG